MPISVALDAMGGDWGPEVNLKGALLALEKNSDFHILLVGDQSKLEPLIRKRKFKKKFNLFRERISFVHAPEIIEMDEPASTALKKKTQSSIHLGLEQIKNEKAQAFVSMGNSGAIMAASVKVLGKLPGIERPAIIVKIPTQSHFVYLLDAGANVDCKPVQLLRFAQMGHSYLKYLEGISHPRLALLSNGSETSKGNELTRQTHELMISFSVPGYQGYVEGYDVFNHQVDLIVCDGFIGNVTLKVVEGFAKMVVLWFQQSVRKDIKSLVGLLLMKKLLRKFKDRFHYQSHGAAPLLGSEGIVFIGHGKSKEQAISNGLLAALSAHSKNLLHHLKTELSQLESAHS